MLGRIKTSNRPLLGPVAFGISQTEFDERVSVISIEGELDLLTAPRLKWMLVDSLTAGQDRLVVDLSLASFMDSTALGVLLGVERTLGVDACLAIVCTTPNVLKIFELAGLNGMFAIFPTLDGALAYAQAHGTARRSQS
jgi:anti-sigma B factor antagonist